MSAGESGVRARLGDWVIAVGVAAVLLVTGLSGQRSATNLDLLGYGLLAAGGLALVARRRAPVAVLAVTGLCAVGYQAAGFDVPAVAYLLAVYAAVRAGHRTVTVVASLAMLAVLPLAALASGLHDTGEAFAQARGALEIAWLIAAGAAGEALRQAERRADEAERTREETARRRADGERLHIAREGASTASVRIDCRPNALAIRIDDDGKATPGTAPTPGLGLLGMRERVTALGGRLRAEPRGEGGFTVQAELPVDQTS